MMQRTSNRIDMVGSARFWVVTFSIVIGLGCSRSPDVHYFTLGSEITSAESDRAPDLAVLIGPIRLPAYLERPKLARRAGGGEVEFDEFNRWLGGFESNLATALAAEIRRGLGSIRVVAYPTSAPFPMDYSIRLHVDEWIVDESNTLQVRIRWALVGSDSSPPELADYETTISLSGRSDESVVDAHDAALSELAGQLANAIVAAAEER